jgi:hypothetical protein
MSSGPKVRKSIVSDFMVFLFFLSIVLVIPAIFSLLAMIASRFEKREVWPYAEFPQPTDTRPLPVSDNPYAPPISVESSSGRSSQPVALNDFALTQLRLAEELGFSWMVSTFDANKKLVRVRYEFLMSPDRRAVAVVCCGRVAAIPVQTVIIVSSLADGTWFTTLGAHEACHHDLDRVRTEMVVPGASFPKIWELHSRRIEQLSPKVVEQNYATFFKDFRNSLVKRYQAYEQLGFIHFLDDKHETWHFTWKGAMRFVLLGQCRQLRRMVFPDSRCREPLLGFSRP